MPDDAIAILLPLLLTFLGISLALLIRPSVHFRLRPNVSMPNTPWIRLQIRMIGLVFCLMLLAALSYLSAGVVKPRFLKGVSSNLLVALWIAFATLAANGIASALLWRISAFRAFIRRRYPSDKLQNPSWERRMTWIFCLVLLFVVASSLVLAAEGYHP